MLFLRRQEPPEGSAIAFLADTAMGELWVCDLCTVSMRHYTMQNDKEKHEIWDMLLLAFQVLRKVMSLRRETCSLNFFQTSPTV